MDPAQEERRFQLRPLSVVEYVASPATSRPTSTVRKARPTGVPRGMPTQPRFSQLAAPLTVATTSVPLPQVRPGTQGPAGRRVDEGELDGPFDAVPTAPRAAAIAGEVDAAAAAQQCRVRPARRRKINGTAARRLAAAARDVNSPRLVRQRIPGPARVGLAPGNSSVVADPLLR